MGHTDTVRNFREVWFRTIPGARDAYLNDHNIRTTVDSVDSALSMVDRALDQQGIPEDVRHLTLYYAVFKTEADDVGADGKDCPRCKGSGIDPEHSSPGCTDPDRGAEPPNLEPCIACQYPIRPTED